MINIGIVGLGFIGQFHAENIRKNKTARLSGVCDTRSNLCQNYAEKYSCEPSQNYQELIEGGGLDAIYVCTPNAYHTDIVLKAVKHNLHIFSEKPMATTLDEAKAIQAAVKGNTKIKYQVGHNRRFAPAYKKLKELIDSKVTPYVGHVKMMRGGLKTPTWVNDPKISGGFLYESTIHVLDSIDYFFSGIKSVRAYTRNRLYKDQIDEIVCLFQTKSDSLITLTSVGHSTWIKPFERFEIVGDHCCIETQEMDRLIYSPTLEPSNGDITYDFNQLSISQKWGYEEEDDLFINSILNDSPTILNEDIGLRAVELVEAIKSSAKKSGEDVIL